MSSAKSESYKKYDLEERLVEFASNTVVFCSELPSDMTGAYYGNQILRSSGSTALNFEEAQGTIRSRDQAYRINLCLKELKESRVNLKILTKVNCGDEFKRNMLLDEAEQFIKIMATIIKNKRD